MVKCSGCGKYYARSRPDWVTCLKCEEEAIRGPRWPLTYRPTDGPDLGVAAIEDLDVLEAAERLVTRGEAEWVAPEPNFLDWAVYAYERQEGPCPFPGHRGSEWRGDGGRLICGVCHPPAKR